MEPLVRVFSGKIMKHFVSGIVRIIVRWVIEKVRPWPGKRKCSTDAVKVSRELLGS